MILEDESPVTSSTGLVGLPAIDAGLTDPTNTFRREDMYAPDGR
jgi:hypothetical protein